MRGEESQLAGLLTAASAYPAARESIVILPGTHSKHARIRDGRIVSFRTIMTGELRDVLSAHSVLRHSMAGAVDTDTATPAWRSGFEAAVAAARTRGLTGGLFTIRARTLLDRLPAATASGMLRGLLIGAELLTLETGDDGVPRILCAAEPLAPLYRGACDLLGIEGVHALPPGMTSELACRGHAVFLAAQR